MRTAVCSGSFDPITLGHLDIIQRAAACFDQIWVCVSPNAEKRSPMFTPEQKLLLVQTAIADLPNVKAELFHGLLADFARREGLEGRLISVPRSLTSDCGLAWSAPPELRPVLERRLSEAGVETAGFHTLTL